MKVSARNKLHGTIVDVIKGATTAHVRIDLGGGAVVTASITNEAVDELKLNVNDLHPFEREKFKQLRRELNLS